MCTEFILRSSVTQLTKRLEKYCVVQARDRKRLEYSREKKLCVQAWGLKKKTILKRNSCDERALRVFFPPPKKFSALKARGAENNWPKCRLHSCKLWRFFPWRKKQKRLNCWCSFWDRAFTIVLCKLSAKRTKRGYSERVDPLQGFQDRVMRLKCHQLFHVKLGFALCCFRSNYRYVLPLLPALPCSKLPLMCVRDLRLIISTLTYANFESRFWIWISAYNYCCALIHKKVVQNN